jgi:hypothetical protein
VFGAFGPNHSSREAAQKRHVAGTKVLGLHGLDDTYECRLQISR